MEKNKTRKYLKYAIGEILLVVIGILIALQINNLNENRKLKILETDILKEIKTALENDLDDVLYNLKKEKEKFVSQNIIIDWLESDLEYNDSLSIHFSHIQNGTFFKDNEGAYETLKQIGLRIIVNDSLRKQISELYDREYELYVKFNTENTRQIELMSSNNGKYFNERTYYGTRMKPLDIKGIKTDKEFIYYLKTIRNFNQLRTRMFIPKTVSEISKTIEMIKEELRHREK